MEKKRTNKTADPYVIHLTHFNRMFRVAGYTHRFKRHDHLVYEYGIRLFFLLKGSFINALRAVNVLITGHFTTQTDISLLNITKNYVQFTSAEILTKHFVHIYTFEYKWLYLIRDKFKIKATRLKSKKLYVAVIYYYCHFH